jgi:zinc protease
VPAPTRVYSGFCSEPRLTEHLSLDGVERHVLRNGLTVLVRRDRAAPVVAIVAHVNAGYFDESDDVTGISHVLEHMFFKGTPRRAVGEIARETKAKGGYLNAHTIYDHTAYFTVLPSSSLEAGLDIQADAYAQSLIDAEELKKELDVIIQEAKRKLDTPSSVAVESLFALLHDRHRIRRWRIGTEEGLRRLEREDVVAFYKAYYRPSNTILTVVGDAEPSRMLALIEKFYGGLEDAPVPRDRGPAEEGSPDFRLRQWDGDVSRTQLVLGWRTPPAIHPDTTALDVLAIILGSGRASRLYRAVRDRQLASGIAASNHTPAELGVFTIHAEVPPAKARAAIQAAWGELQSVREFVVDNEELLRAQRIMQSLWLRRFESMEGQAMWLSAWEALGSFRLGYEYYDRVMSLSPADVNDVARRYLDPGHASLAIYGPRDSQPLARDAAEMQSFLRMAVTPAPALKAEHVTSPAVFSRRRARLEQVSGPVRVYRTEDAIPILVRRMPGSPLLHASVHTLGGVTAEDPSLAGLTLLMARTAIRGTTRRTAEQIADELELHGGFLSASVGSEGFGWTTSSPAEHMGATLDLLADVTQNPVFPAEALETERSVLLGEIALARDDMYRQPIRLALDAAFRGHSYGRAAQGSEESVARVQVNDLIGWHALNAITGPVVLAIVADRDEDELAEVMATNFPALRFGAREPQSPPAWPAESAERAETRDKEQTALAVLMPSACRGDDDRFAADLIATIGSGLGGRFFDELRDRQSLAYTVHAYPLQRRAAGAFVGYIATSPDKEVVALNGMLAELEKLRETEVSGAELDRAREYMTGARVIRLQSGAAVLGEMVEAWLYGTGLLELQELEERLRSVSAGDIREFARKYFDVDRRVVGIVRGRT